MPEDPQNRKRSPERRMQSPLEQTSAKVETGPEDVAKQRLAFLKDRLLALFAQMQHKSIAPNEARLDALLLQDEVSELIWILDDWQLQASTRN